MLLESFDGFFWEIVRDSWSTATIAIYYDHWWVSGQHKSFSLIISSLKRRSQRALSFLLTLLISWMRSRDLSKMKLRSQKHVEYPQIKIQSIGGEKHLAFSLKSLFFKFFRGVLSQSKQKSCCLLIFKAILIIFAKIENQRADLVCLIFFELLSLDSKCICLSEVEVASLSWDEVLFKEADLKLLVLWRRLLDGINLLHYVSIKRLNGVEYCLEKLTLLHEYRYSVSTPANPISLSPRTVRIKKGVEI